MNAHYIYNITSPVLKVFGLDGLLTGFWLIGGTIFPYIIRKPGSAFLGETIASIVECVISQWGFSAIIYGVIQGGVIEILFLTMGYKKWNLTSMIFAGLLSGIAGFLLSVLWYKYYHLSLMYNIVQLIVHAISGAVLAGYLGKFLADSLVPTGVLNNFAIVRANIK
mgnify:CR=1 FL=1